MPELSKRMKAIVDWIDADCAADIGCDHAYVICEAVRQKRCQRGYACDISEGPLNRARHTIIESHLQEQVIPRLQNGLVPLPEEVEQAVIAGMGGKTIISILDSWCSQKDRRYQLRLILSPHSDSAALRRWLSTHLFSIEQEIVVYDEGHWYPVMLVCSDKQQSLSSGEEEYGKNVVIDENRKRYLESEIEKWIHVLPKVPAKRARQIKEHIEVLKKLLKVCEDSEVCSS